jgi:hypothetical protein
LAMGIQRHHVIVDSHDLFLLEYAARESFPLVAGLIFRYLPYITVHYFVLIVPHIIFFA